MERAGNKSTFNPTQPTYPFKTEMCPLDLTKSEQSLLPFPSPHPQGWTALQRHPGQEPSRAGQSRPIRSVPLGVGPLEMVQEGPGPRNAVLSPRAYWRRTVSVCVHTCMGVCAAQKEKHSSLINAPTGIHMNPQVWALGSDTGG